MNNHTHPCCCCSGIKRCPFADPCDMSPSEAIHCKDCVEFWLAQKEREGLIK